MLEDDYDLQSVWKIAEVALACVKPEGMERPSISEVLKEIRGAIAVERGSGVDGEGLVTSKTSMCSSANLDPVDSATPDRHSSLTVLFGARPGLR